MQAKFDEYARKYTALHDQNLAASGESSEYFAEYKLARLIRIGAPEDEPFLDYGCGIGNVLVTLARHFTRVHGYDPSAASLAVARERIPTATFYDSVEKLPPAHFATAMLSGVIHHVPRAERIDVLAGVRTSLKASGRLVVFEHNPLNPLTRHAVATCPFDDDADLLWPWNARALLRAAGFRNVRLEFIVFFPRALSFARPLEPHLHWLPAGAQMMLVGSP